MTTSVLVLGAGFGGLEFCARVSAALGDEVDITLIDRSDGFVFGFSKLAIMFGKDTPDGARTPYRELRTRNVRFRQETILQIDPEARRAVTDGGRYEADVLLIALGADYDLAATPGLAEVGHEFYSVAGATALRSTIAGFSSGTAIVGVCGTPFKCPPAPSEAALLLDRQLRDRGVRDAVRIQLVMPTPRPVPPSPEMSQAILARFAERGVEFLPERRVVALDEATREAVLADGERLPFDLSLGVPVHRAPSVVVEAGLTEGGWIPVDRQTLATRFPGVYAVGDVVDVGTPKAGVFAERAARVVAEHVIVSLRGGPEPRPFDGRGSCYIEFDDEEVARVDVDFFTTPGTPIGTFTPPSAATASEKQEFATTRRDRWFAGFG
jgi:sulfide:quinone oxidoreductase